MLVRRAVPKGEKKFKLMIVIEPCTYYKVHGFFVCQNEKEKVDIHAMRNIIYIRIALLCEVAYECRI